LFRLAQDGRQVAEHAPEQAGLVVGHQPFDLAGVEPDAVALGTAIDGDAVELLLDQIGAALAALLIVLAPLCLPSFGFQGLPLLPDEFPVSLGKVLGLGLAWLVSANGQCSSLGKSCQVVSPAMAGAVGPT